MRALRRRVLSHDVGRWADLILEKLARTDEVRRCDPTSPTRRRSTSCSRWPGPRGRWCCCSTTTARWSRSPRRPIWPAPTPRRWPCWRRWPPDRGPRCTWSAAAPGRHSSTGSAVCRSICTRSTGCGPGRRAARAGRTSRRCRRWRSRVLAILQRLRQPHARLAGRGEARRSGLALPGGRPGVRLAAGQRAAAAPARAAEQRPAGDPGRGQGDRGAPARGRQGPDRAGDLAAAPHGVPARHRGRPHRRRSVRGPAGRVGQHPRRLRATAARTTACRTSGRCAGCSAR